MFDQKIEHCLWADLLRHEHDRNMSNCVKHMEQGKTNIELQN